MTAAAFEPPSLARQRGWDGFLERWLGEATDTMLDHARVGPGSRVLDVAAGTGGQTLAAARRTGPRGEVLATDHAAELVERLRTKVAVEHALHVRTAVATVDRVEVEPASRDSAICRLGLVFLPDLPAALRRVRAALRRGGRLSAIVLAEPEHNGFLEIAAAGASGAFALSRTGAVERELRAAGFVDVDTIRVDAPLRMASAADCVCFLRASLATLHRIPRLDEAAWPAVERKLRTFEGPDGFRAPCRLLVVGGSRP